MKKIFTIPALSLAALLIVSCAGGSRKSGIQITQTPDQAEVKIPYVETISAAMRDVPDESSYSSTVEAYATNNIVSQSAGRIRKLNAEVGDYVYKGQVLVEMDRLQLDQTRMQFRNDSTELERLRQLYSEGGVAKSDLESMELAFNVRKATLKNLEENTILRSPITGYVTARNYDKNDMYAMSMPIYTVQQVVPVKLLVGISESEYTKVKKGDNVALTVDALPGREFTGRVVRLYPTVNAATHTFNAEVVVGNSDRALRPGMYARVTVNFGTNRRIVVPDQAIVRQEGTGQRFVYLVNEDNTVSYVPVVLGRHMGAEYEIVSGIPEGATVVAKGQSALKDGVKVEILNK